MVRWITDTSFGQRLKFVRRFRKLTQKDLGVLMGYPEKSADVRIAQYEKNARIPKKATVLQLADILKVSPAIFSKTICSSCEDLLQSMYWLYLLKGGGDIYDCLDQFTQAKMQYKNGERSLEEFLENVLTNKRLPSGSPE